MSRYCGRKHRLDYQPLFGKMSPHTSSHFGEDQRPNPGDSGNRAYRKHVGTVCVPKFRSAQQDMSAPKTVTTQRGKSNGDFPRTLRSLVSVQLWLSKLREQYYFFTFFMTQHAFFKRYPVLTLLLYPVLGFDMTSPKFKLRNYRVFWVSTFM